MLITSSRLARCLAVATIGALALTGAAASAAADEHVTGNITVVTGTGFAMQLRSGMSKLVTVTDETKIRQINDDILLAKSDLIPGLEVDVEGTTDGQGRLVARKVEFSKEDLEHALEVKAALTPLDQAIAQNSMAIAQNSMAIQQIAQALGLQKNAMGEYAGTLSKYQSQLADQDSKIVATTGTLSATNARLSSLADYNVVETITIHFANNSAKLPKDAMTRLGAFAAKAKGVEAYRLAVEGHASAVGRVSHNTVLSHLRAEAVTAALQQQGVPTTNIFVPAALGTTGQVAENKTAKGQAQNRRVVVSLLQNKGIAER